MDVGRTATTQELIRSHARGVAGAVTTLGKVILALFVFVGALQIMKTGAADLSILQSGSWLVRNAGSTLGLGWLGALLVLSGSPVAASGLALVAGGSISETQGFTMLTGSRLGAAFVVLLVGVIYALRGGAGHRGKPVSTAVIALCLTAVLYIPGSLIGLAILRSPLLGEIGTAVPPQFTDLTDLVYGGMLDRIGAFPGGVLFIGGVLLLLLSFRLIDSVVPEMSAETMSARMTRMLRSKWTMFGLGCLVAAVTMSVSVALTILVPLVAKKLVKRDDIFPYIIGANITTLGDTLVASFMLDSAAAVRIVLADIIGVSVVAFVVLAFFYEPVRHAIWTFQLSVIRSRTRLGVFTAALFLIPLTLIAISAVAG